MGNVFVKLFFQIRPYKTNRLLDVLPTLTTIGANSVLEQNSHQSTRGIAGMMNALRLTVNHHLEKLGKASKLGVWIHHKLSERNKEHRISIALTGKN